MAHVHVCLCLSSGTPPPLQHVSACPISHTAKAHNIALKPAMISLHISLTNPITFLPLYFWPGPGLACAWGWGGQGDNGTVCVWVLTLVDSGSVGMLTPTQRPRCRPQTVSSCHLSNLRAERQTLMSWEYSCQ